MYDLFWSEIPAFFHYVPDGYKLVEDEEHKKKRLQKSIDEKKGIILSQEKRLKILQEEIEKEEKELGELK